MKVILTANSVVTVNGIDIVLGKGTEVELPCQTPSHALEICAITKFPVDLNYTENGVEYIAGANGKFIVKPKVEKPKAEPKAEPKAPKAKAKK